MDQDDSKGQDKRNWRERLGIGAQGSKDLPKISDDYRKDQAPASSATRPVASARPAPRPAVATAKPAPAVRPAPMAPRANPKPAQPAPIAADKLAERLRSQREASTKLAEQRVQVAKQRAETQYAPPPPVAAQQASANKPKFTFAEENAVQRPSVPPPPVRPQMPVPQAGAPQLSPARPPLGGVQSSPNIFTPRPQQMPMPQQPTPGYAQTPQGVPPYQPQYNQQPVPPYRPIDPSSGYAPQPGYVPQQRGFAPPPMQQPAYPPLPANGPRLNVPQRPPGSLNPNYAPQQNYVPPAGYTGPRLNPTQPRVQMPAQAPEGEFEDEFYDEVPTPRATRPSSGDYQQAYREAEYGYEEEAPRSKAPWILAGLVIATMLIVGLGALLYENTIKPLMTGQSTTQEVPAVAAPDAPAKVQAEEPAAASSQPASATPSKKQIYDRIVGDQEILGGALAPALEEPAAIPEPSSTSDPAIQPSGGAGEDAAPLPIPPPPGGAGEQQGSLDPASQKQSVETITPAAGESQAAVAADGDVPLPAVAPPAPGELDKISQTASTGTPSPEAEAIEDVQEPVVEKKKVVASLKKKPEVAKPKKVVEKSLGAKPVVLVAPAKKPQAKTVQSSSQSDNTNQPIDSDGGLYAGDGLAENTPPENSVVTPAPKKKKSLFGDVFKTNDADAVAEQSIDPPEQPVAPKKPVASTRPVPAETQVASGGAGSFVVQLASFRSRAEAQTEYTRLKAKHSGTLGRFSPIISEATVGGAQRFRLSVGSMESRAQANAVCSSLFAGGERDCLVKSR